MKNWVRWSGLIAFTAILALVAVFWLFFLDSIVRRTVERAGTALAGAEVDVAAARLTLSPLGLSLSGIQVTDPQEPSRNSFELGRAAFSLDALNLLRRKVIIQEMTADGMRFGTARKTPGFVVPAEKKPEPEKKSSTFALPSFEMPDVKKILASETFASVKIIDDAKADLQKTSDAWKQRIADLPTKATLDSYRTRLDKLKAAPRSNITDIASAAAEAKNIATDLDRDIERVKTSRAALTTDLSSARALVAKAEQSPFDDIRRITDKYSLSPSGLQNLTHALFGGKISSWFDSGLLWYSRISPLLAASADRKGNVKVAKPLRGKGVDVKFPERQPLPDFLIRTAKASLQPEDGLFTGTITNITTDQDVLGLPLTFAFSGTGMKDVATLAVSGALDHIRPPKINDTLRIQANGYRAADMVLSSNKDLPISLQDGLMDIQVTAMRTQNGLTAKLVSTFRSVRISTGKPEASSPIARALANALSRVSNFSLVADISGQPGNYDIKVSSDLDRVFKDAIGSIVKEQSGRIEKELKAAVQEKTDEKLKELKAGLGGLNTLGGSIDSVQSQLNALKQEATQKAAGKTRLPF